MAVELGGVGVVRVDGFDGLGVAEGAFDVDGGVVGLGVELAVGGAGVAELVDEVLSAPVFGGSELGPHAATASTHPMIVAARNLMVPTSFGRLAPHRAVGPSSPGRSRGAHDVGTLGPGDVAAIAEALRYDTDSPHHQRHERTTDRRRR